MAKILNISENQEKIVKLFEAIECRYGIHTLWSDFVALTACDLAIVDTEPRRKEMREKMRTDIAAKYRPAEMSVFSEALKIVTESLEENPNQDFFGKLYMAVGLGNGRMGQFFTPYNICSMMAKMLFFSGLPAEVERKGTVRVSDPCSGAGGLLIAVANAAKEQGVNYRDSIFFVARDLDFTAAMMCYVQLSLLGCAGCVIVGDSLSCPPVTSVNETTDVWYTPYCFRDIRYCRRPVALPGEACDMPASDAAAEKRSKKEFDRIKNRRLEWI
jgi:hypothetical protein